MKAEFYQPLKLHEGNRGKGTAANEASHEKISFFQYFCCYGIPNAVFQCCHEQISEIKPGGGWMGLAHTGVRASSCQCRDWPLTQGKDGLGTPCRMFRGKQKGLTSSSGLGPATFPVQDSGLRVLFQNIFFQACGQCSWFCCFSSMLKCAWLSSDFTKGITG